MMNFYVIASFIEAVRSPETFCAMLEHVLVDADQVSQTLFEGSRVSRIVGGDQRLDATPQKEITRGQIRGSHSRGLRLPILRSAECSFRKE